MGITKAILVTEFRWLDLKYVILYILIITIAMVVLLYSTNSPPFGPEYTRW